MTKFGGQGLLFSGSTQYVKTAAAQMPQSAFSFSIWLKIRTAGTYGIVNDVSATSSAQYVQTFVSTTAFTMRIGNVTTSLSNYIGRTTPAITPGVWRHIVGIWDGGTTSSAITIYVDNVRADNANSNAGTFTAPYAGSVLPLYIGAQDNTIWLNGSLADVRVYDRALSVADVATLYNDPLRDYFQPIDRIWGRLASVAGTNYSLAAANGTFALSGQATTLRAARRLTAANATFALSGQATTLRAGRRLTAANGTLSLSGQAATLRAARQIAAANGSFALSGQAATLRAARRLTAANGTFALSGQVVTLRATRRLVIGGGLLSLSGQAVLLRAVREITVDYGLFSFGGQDVSLGGNTAYVLVAAAGTIALLGQATTLRASRRLTADYDLFDLNGQIVTLRALRRLLANRGLFALNGQNIGLGDAPQVYSIAAALGAFTLVGEDADFHSSYLLRAGSRLFTIYGEPISLGVTLPPQVPMRITRADGTILSPVRRALYALSRRRMR